MMTTHTNLIPTVAAVLNEREAMNAAATAEAAQGVPFFDRALTDPVITPFVRALKAEGYAIKKTRNDKHGCDVLGTCPACRSRYLFTAIKDGAELQACPHCHDAAMKNLQAEAVA
jgi:hypothetical protein